LPNAITKDPAIGFKDKSVPNKMIVISDGDVVRNQISKNSSEAYPLGFDRFSGETFGNKNFLLNCVNYLLDESGLIAVRSREIKLRMLDKTKIENEKLFWQLLNVVSPLLIIITFGLIMFFIRKRKFSV
jgi:ABC-2 type transport system permease protein